MGIIVPFASGLGLGLWSWEPLAREADRLAYALFVATAFAITALPVLGRILIQLDLHRTRIGTIAIAAAAVTDVIGWLLLGTVTALTLARFSGPELAADRSGRRVRRDGLVAPAPGPVPDPRAGASR